MGRKGRLALNTKGLVMAKKAAEVKPSEKVDLSPMDVKIFDLRLHGTAGLICNKWSEKAKQQMRDKQQKRAKDAKEAKNPEECFKGSLYPYPGGGYGFPSIAFKAAAVDACSHVDGITKVLARGAFHIQGDLVKIDGTPEMREDMVRVGMGVADLRYRGEFREWSCVVKIRYNARVLSAEQIVNLFRIAGFAIGVGEHRPQRDGSNGMFDVVAA
jgi:hypothetical protein